MAEMMTARVVVVDHPEVQRVIRNILEAQGCSVTEAGAAEAIHLLASRAPEIDLLITNTCDCFASTVTSVPVLCLSGAPAEEFREHCERRNCRMMRKPFLAHELVETIRSLLGASHSQSER